MKKNLFCLAIALILTILTGCAGYKVNPDGSVDSYGVFRTLTDVIEYNQDGSIKKRSISTDSKFADVMMGVNELLDTAVNTAAKLKP